jgi:siroheme synthase-like protein
VNPTARGLPITLDLEGAQVVLVGGGDEAERKGELCVEAGAELRRIDDGAAFRDADLDGARLALVTARDPALAARVHAAARARGILCWACDDPARSDLAMPAVARLGAARVAISTSGFSPVLAARLRAAIETALGERFTRFVEVLGALRERAKSEPDATRRRATLQAAVDGFSLEIAARYPEWFK